MRPLTLLCLFAVAAGLFSVAALAQNDTPANPVGHDAAAVAAGRAIYNTTCAACHGTEGAGGSGPALTARPLQHGATDEALFSTIHDGIDGSNMPSFSSLSDENIRRVISYLQSLAAPPRPPKAPTADAAAGGRLFFGSGNCTACHEINGRGMDLAQDLSAEGARTPDIIRNGIRHRTPTGSTATVTLNTGKSVSGLIRAQDTFTLQLEQRDGTRLVLDKKSLRSITPGTPLAGPEIAARLSAPDIDNLAAFLADQKARNLAETAKLNPLPLLPFARIAAPDARDWTNHRGTLDGDGFSALNQITAATAGHLQARWSATLGDGGAASTPMAAGGILYVSGANGEVSALDARSGLVLWRFARQPVISSTAPGGNRGVALLDGRLFVGASDNKLIALDAHNGRELWEKQTASTLDGYVMHGAPLALRDRIILGVAGSGPKARGWLDAYDPPSGKQLWRLQTVTTADVAGATTAGIGAADAGKAMLYWSTTAASNGGPDGDSLLAIHADSGTVAWRHSLKPGTGGGNIALVEGKDHGKQRALLLYLGRDGLLTLLDRADGKVVLEKSLADGPVADARFSLDRSSGVLTAALGDLVLAADARTGRVLWRTILGSVANGVLATRGGVVFVSTAEGNFLALDGKGGKVLWNFRTTGPITATPMSYAVDGKQFVAVTAQNMLYAFALPN